MGKTFKNFGEFKRMKPVKTQKANKTQDFKRMASSKDVGDFDEDDDEFDI